MFEGVLTRDGDYFISVMGRSDDAHVSKTPISSCRFTLMPHRTAVRLALPYGCSLTVAPTAKWPAGWSSTRNSSRSCWVGRVMCWRTVGSDPYLSQAVLDLQFGHSQRVGYDVATSMISQLQRIGEIHKRRPEHASLGVLRCRISREYWSKPVLSATTAKNVCWRATITNNSWQKPFTKACAIISLRIRCDLRRRGQRHELPLR